MSVYHENKLLFYGRRHGRKLRPQQADTLARGLSEFSLVGKLPAAPIDPRGFFSHAPSKIFLEIGFGGGEHLSARAVAAPDSGFIGAEPFMNGVARLCRHLIDGEIGNVRVWPDDVRLLLPQLEPASLDGIFILFPDPWPKFRHQGRRILQPEMLAQLSRLLRVGGFVSLASDDSTAKTWILEQMLRASIYRGGIFSWDAASFGDCLLPPRDWPGTRYMAKADIAGRRSMWFTFIKQH